MIRIGLGYDLHKLVLGRKLILGGVELPGIFGSLAHSDGDALIHAVIDALLSPLGAGDIGKLFPDSNDKWKGISSLDLLRTVKKEYLKNKEIINIDCVVILDQPKIAPYTAEMKKNIAGILEIPEERIGIKGKTTENTRIYTVECYTAALLDIV